MDAKIRKLLIDVLDESRTIINAFNRLATDAKDIGIIIELDNNFPCRQFDSILDFLGYPKEPDMDVVESGVEYFCRDYWLDLFYDNEIYKNINSEMLLDQLISDLDKLRESRPYLFAGDSDV